MAKQYPISHPQKRILNAELIDSSTDKYLIYPCYGFKNADLPALRIAVANVVTQCADLNLRFKIAADGFTVTQYIGSPDLNRIKLLDFSGDPAAMRRYLNVSHAAPFEPFWDAPLYEFTIIHGDETSFVQTKIHHAISDGSGVVCLGQLLNTAYQAALQKIAFKPQPSDYLAYLEIERQYLRVSKKAVYSRARQKAEGMRRKYFSHVVLFCLLILKPSLC
jgi:NRPS condensation-like uncharacterized protein